MKDEHDVLYNGRLRAVEICAAMVENEIKHLKEDTTEMKQDLREIKTNQSKLQEEHQKQFEIMTRTQREAHLEISTLLTRIEEKRLQLAALEAERAFKKGEEDIETRKLDATVQIANTTVRKDYFIAIASIIGTLLTMGVGYFLAQ